MNETASFTRLQLCAAVYPLSEASHCAHTAVFMADIDEWHFTIQVNDMIRALERATHVLGYDIVKRDIDEGGRADAAPVA